MDNQKQQVVDRIKQANNVLVTVSANPSVDQLAACMALALALNKLKKHATAVFSGAVPSTIEFLQPEKTLEKTTDSLRDFIIALDKSKADKLRYKIEDKVVKIFITPYRTSIGEKDLQFSEGDFNVDVVVALGVHRQADLDQAITAHGRILHDATVIAINTQPNSELGSINVVDQKASSLSEITVELLDLIDKRLVDNQIATALLTGIVAETDRFRNAKTTPKTMSVSAELLAAGANQQLVAAKLEAPPPPPPPPAPTALKLATSGPPLQGSIAKPTSLPAKPDDGTLQIEHDEATTLPDLEEADEPAVHLPKTPQIRIDDQGEVHAADEKLPEAVSPLPRHTEGPHLVLQPPTFASQLTAASSPPAFPSEEALTLPEVEPQNPILDRAPLQQTPSSMSQPNPAPNNSTEPPILNEESISSLERDVDSPHLDYIEPPIPTYPSSSPAPTSSTTPTLQLAPSPSTGAPKDGAAAVGSNATVTAPDPSVNNARDAVSKALTSDPSSPLEPVQALNAQSLGDSIHENNLTTPPSSPPLPPPPPSDQDDADKDSTVPKPPPVPPPMIPPPPPS
ncbi:MAG TPA: hypothetical protein VGS08_03195 [Candidatus Saccharimonadales bacterium]|nr:hypothetical protein [Candidatus Saccharimonadales bacterium]